MQSDIRLSKLCKANVAQVQTGSQVEGLGLTNEINQQGAEPTVGVIDGTNSKTKDCRVKLSLLWKTLHLFFLLLHTISVHGESFVVFLGKRTVYQNGISSGNTQPEFPAISRTIKSCSLHTAAGALPSGGIKRASNNQDSCSLLQFI